MTFRTSPVSSGSSADVGSSKHKISGESARALAIAMRCCCPPESSQGYAAHLSRRPTFERVSFARASIAENSASLSCFFCKLNALPRTFCCFNSLICCFILSFANSSADIFTFFKTFMCGNKLNCWNTSPKCSRFFRRSLYFSFLSLAPSKRVSPSTMICPSSAVSKKFKHRRSVVFPLPEEPIITTTSPLSISKFMPFSTSCAPNDFFRFLTSRIAIFYTL